MGVRTGTKGPLLFDWACIPILHRWQDDETSYSERDLSAPLHMTGSQIEKPITNDVRVTSSKKLYLLLSKTKEIALKMLRATTL